jgi:hypothetical protein
MLQFVRELFKAATSDALDRMGTTALAVGAGLVPWIASLVRDLTTGGVQAAKANWTGGLLWTACIWLLLLGFSLFRHFRPVLREHRRVFHLLAVSRGSWRQPEPVTARAGRVRRRVRPDWPCRGFPISINSLARQIQLRPGAPTTSSSCAILRALCGAFI